MNKRVLTGVLAILLFMAGFVKAGAASYHEGDVENYVMQQLSAANIPGVSLSIVTSQKEIYSVAFGDVKETSSDLQICALSRTFTTLAVMQLAEKGDINLEDRVLKYIKNPSQDIAYSTTIQDLLSYTRPNVHELALADNLEMYNLDTEGTALPLNTKFNLLGEVIENVSGVDYATYIRENITGPLDMQSTYTVDEAGNTPDIIQGSRNYFGLPVKDNIDYKEESYWLGVPSNGIISNVKDIGKYMQMYLSAGGKVISYNTMETIMNNDGEYAGKSIFGTDAYYSMGWISTEIDGEQVYYCNGSVENYTSSMFVIPSMDVGVVILFNSADALTGQKYTDEIEAGAVSLVMGKTARSVSSNSYLMEHGAADVIYFLAFVCSILPLLMMEVWVRWTKDKFSIIRLVADILLHIVLPTALIFAISHYIAPWRVIMKIMPDLFLVSAGVIALFYLGLIVKIIAYVVILLKGDKADGEEDGIEEDNTAPGSSYTDVDIDKSGKEHVQESETTEYRHKEKKTRKGSRSTEEEKEAKEKKDKLLKRMRNIKEAEESETKNRNTETGEQAEEQVTEEQVTEETGTEELTEEQASEEVKPEGTGVEEENIKPAVEDGIIKKEERQETVQKDTDKDNKKKVASEPVKSKPEREKAKPQGNIKNKPKRFVVVNDYSTSKQEKGSSLPESKRNRNNNNTNNTRTGSRNRNTGSTPDRRPAGNNTVNKKRNNYNKANSNTRNINNNLNNRNTSKGNGKDNIK